MNTSNSSKRTTKRATSKNFFLTKKTWFPKVVKGIWIAFVVVVLGIPLYVYIVKADLFGLFGGMTSLKAIEIPENDLSSELISSDGVSLWSYFRYNCSRV